jgi:hypothetical protein
MAWGRGWLAWVPGWGAVNAAWWWWAGFVARGRAELRWRPGVMPRGAWLGLLPVLVVLFLWSEARGDR